MNTKNVVTSIVISVIVVLLGFSIFGGKVETRTIVEKQIGAVSTLDNIDLPYVSIGGKKQYYYSQGMFATSSAVCSIKNPFNATSTLLSYNFQVTSNGIASTQNLYLSTSTTAYATSTPEYIKGFVTGTGQFSGIWSGGGATTSAGIIGATAGSLLAGGGSDNIIGPTNFLNLKVATATAGTYGSYYTGTCSGVIERL